MLTDKNKLKLGLLLKITLRERSLSMHKLSELTGIDTATISRIANGKQPANPNHLQKFARTLNIPIEQLLLTAGYNIEPSRYRSKSDIHTVVDAIQSVLKSSNLIDLLYITERIEQELSKYEQYAQTEEGQQIIRADFAAKVNQVSGTGPFIDQLKQMHQQFCLDGIPINERAILGSALLYFILSTDIIPDYVFPIGYLDDAIAVNLVLNRLSQIKNKEI